MPITGYPTPDNFEGDADFICIPLIVPNKTEFLAAIYGQYAEMTKDYYWKQFGTMLPETAAFLASRGLALTDAYSECGSSMNCDEIADCIESEIEGGNTTLIDVLTQNNISNGFGNPNHVNAAITTLKDRNPVDFQTESINPEFECDLDKLWGAIRHGIVSRLDDNGRDMLEDLAGIPNVLERLSVFIDVVPVVGDIVEGIAFQITEIIPDLLDLYNSASSEEYLDEISCEIFALVCNDCRYPTFEEVFNQYFDNSISGLPNMVDMTLEQIAEKILELIGNPAAVAYNTIMVWQLWVLLAGATFNQVSSKNAISKMAAIGEDFGSNNWFDLCETCNELWSYLTFDYTVDANNAYRTDGFSSKGGTWVAGQGWRIDKVSATGGRLTLAQPVDTTWRIRSIGYETSVPKTELTANLYQRPIVNSQTSAVSLNLTLDGSDNPNVRCRDNLVGSPDGFSEIAISLISDPIESAFLQSMTIIYSVEGQPSNARPTANSSACEFYE